MKAVAGLNWLSSIEDFQHSVSNRSMNNQILITDVNEDKDVEKMSTN